MQSKGIMTKNTHTEIHIQKSQPKGFFYLKNRFQIHKYINLLCKLQMIWKLELGIFFKIHKAKGKYK